MGVCWGRVRLRERLKMKMSKSRERIGKKRMPVSKYEESVEKSTREIDEKE